MTKYELTPLRERLLSRMVIQPSGCVVWTGALNHQGYGNIARGRRIDGYAKTHRLMYEIFAGPIPDGLEPDHLCRNRACGNVDHMELVTHQVNCSRRVILEP